VARASACHVGTSPRPGLYGHAGTSAPASRCVIPK
jgi:hypothetical protein